MYGRHFKYSTKYMYTYGRHFKCMYTTKYMYGTAFKCMTNYMYGTAVLWDEQKHTEPNNGSSHTLLSAQRSNLFVSKRLGL